MRYDRVVAPKTVVFCGTPPFAVFSLRSLHGSPLFRVLHVVTQPDRPVGRSQEILKPAVKVAAEELGLPVWQPENINDAFAAGSVPFLKPDFLVVVAYGKILKPDVLAFPAVAPINVHASILPRWRGASPIEHAILHGDDRTGVTVQIMGEKMDEGDILGMAQTAIGPAETTVGLKEKLARMGADLLVETLSMPLSPRPQTTDGVTYCGKLSKEDGLADTGAMTAQEIDRRLRALSPWPGVQLSVRGKTVKLLRASLQQSPHAVPLSCKDGSTLYVSELVEAGKKPMKAVEWVRGVR